MNNARHLLVTLAMAGAAVLGGCFGGGGDSATPSPVADPLAAVPDSATQSVAGTIDYLAELGRQPSETREAVDITAVVLPVSDTDEPRAVD
jgi:hypothetical protein